MIVSKHFVCCNPQTICALLQKSSSGKSVGIKDVGREVYVGPVGKGILRYIGSIKGKQGLFCGIELEKPDGKHNGTYQGKNFLEIKLKDWFLIFQFP